MKSTIQKLFMFTSTLGIFCINGQDAGSIPKEVRDGNIIYREKLNYIIDVQSYTSGGTIFSYPSNWFSTAPRVNVSLQINVPFSTDITYSAVVVANDTTQVHVRVSKCNSSTMTSTEADPDEVTVTVYAIGDPA